MWRRAAVPFTVRVSGLLFTVPTIASVVDRVPSACGVAVKMSVHRLPAAIVPPSVQLPPVREKSPGLPVVRVWCGVDRTSFAVPVLDTVTVIAELADILVGEVHGTRRKGDYRRAGGGS
jgi:hypothetical protein